jgi:peptidoglycan/xylan/chitin deacetylase (PgdA/CDA1 family)
MKRTALCMLLALSLGTLAAGPAPSAGAAPIRVGVFNGNGASASSLQNAMEALRIDPSIRALQISAAEIAAGGLDGLDVILFPGGGGGRQRTDLGDEGAALVRSFVLEKGKGAVGLCAGAYLLSDTPDYACLHLCPLKAIDREHDERGHGLITFRPTAEGLEAFPELKGWGEGHIFYYEGPILVPTGEGPSACTVLATMESDVHLENDAPAGMTPGRPLFARAEAGKGRVFLSAGHPEATPGLRWIVARAVRWAARREAVPYTAAVVRPGLRGEELLFDKALRDEEAALFQALMYGTAPDKMAAIRRLATVRSWDGPLWIRGLVRSEDPAVRVCAARTLVDLEWTAGVPDLEAAVNAETDAVVRANLSLCLKRLEAMTPALGERGGPGGKRVVAITLDDLPLVNAGTDDPVKRRDEVGRLLAALAAQRVPATAFVVGKNTDSPGGEQLLDLWVKGGVQLGNHTQSHRSLHEIGAQSYEADMAAEDVRLRATLAASGQAPAYFRHPMLQSGRDQATKRAVDGYAESLGYEIAPVTIDNSEWVFAKAYAVALQKGDGDAAAKVKAAYLPYMESKVDYWERQSKQLLGYEVRQILLIHASALNADALPQLLGMMKRRGYAFISLGDALKDPAYALPDGYTGGGGISWLHRWAIALGGKAALLPGEPLCPPWVMELAGVDSE